MKKIVFVVFVSLLLWTPNAFCGVLNDRSLDDFKGFVNSLEVKDGVLYDFDDNVWMNTISGSLFTLQDKAHELGLASLRAGYGVQEVFFGEIEANIPAIVSTYIPEQLKNFQINVKALKLFPSVGFAVGYDFQQKDISWGPTVGIKGIF